MQVNREKLLQRLEEAEEQQAVIAKELMQIRVARQALEEAFAMRWHTQEPRWKETLEGVKFRQEYNSSREEMTRRLEFKMAELDAASLKTARAQENLEDFEDQNP
jgi:hypothetical protein